MSAPAPENELAAGVPSEPLDAGFVGFVGGNRVALLQGGDELFPAMQRAMAVARAQVWIAAADRAGSGVDRFVRTEI